MIDTHCHLTFPELRPRVDELMALAARHGVRGAITISTTTFDCLDALALARSRSDVWSTAGVHPLHADPRPQREDGRGGTEHHEWANLLRCINDERCVAWGELGLDNHYPDPPKDLQHEALAHQLAMIQQHDRDGGKAKPVVLHCREAFDELIPILKRTSIDPGRFVFHCFTAGPREMRAVLDFGACVSFTGVLTYRNADEVRQAAALVPVGRVMVETDAPFLSPEPERRERPCHPAMTRHTLDQLARARGVTYGAMHEEVNATTRRFLGVGV